jgi:hypothetical protein
MHTDAIRLGCFLGSVFSDCGLTEAPARP